MKIGMKLAGSMSLAIGLALASSAIAAPRLGGSDGATSHAQSIKLYLADPELGLAGRIAGADGEVLYFQSKQLLDAKTGEAVGLALHIVDSQARTVVAAGVDGAGDDAVHLPVKEAMAVSDLLGELSSELAALDLHPALGQQKVALSGLAAEAAARSPFDYPVQLDSAQLKSAAVSTQTLTDFYLRAASDIELKRGEGGTLLADIGNGLAYESAQFFRADEENENGEMGRIDVYSRMLDAHGQNLGAELGGDWVPDGWDDLLGALPKVERSHDEIAADMGAGAMALNALALGAKSSYGVAFSNQLEQESMYRLARSLADNLLPQRDVEGLAPGEAMAKAGGRYRTAIQVHKKWLVWPTEHSATRVYQHLFTSTTSNVYSVTATLNFCNHGTCAGGSGMSQKCSWTGPRLTFYRVPQTRWVPAGQTGAGTRHTCSTNYGVAGFQNHNCHDDSSVQVRAVRGLSYSHNGGRCKDWDFWATAPGCS